MNLCNVHWVIFGRARGSYIASCFMPGSLHAHHLASTGAPPHTDASPVGIKWLAQHHGCDCNMPAVWQGSLRLVMTGIPAVLTYICVCVCAQIY